MAQAALVLALQVAAPSLLAAPIAGAPPSSQVAWVSAQSGAEVDRAFADARRAGKPVLLYWGATWCPPCNQLKATLFNRQDFAALARSFVAVHLDGDRPGAQKLGQRFKVRGYPTLVMFKPDGEELTRLPGDADAEQVMELLKLGLAGGRPVMTVLTDARAGRPVSASEWRLLAFYSWETDDERVLGNTPAATVLAELAPAAQKGGAGDLAPRLWLKALAASDDGKGLKADAGLRDRVRKWLADPALVRAHADLIGGSAAEIVRALSDEPEGRAALLGGFDAALRQLTADAGLSRADRLTALLSRLELARLEVRKKELRPAMPEPLLAELRTQVAAADQGIADAYERQAVLPLAAYMLERAGLWAEARALLEANLARSVSPYYLMSQLGSLERKLGRDGQALAWYAKAFEQSRGPATRLQWGAGYLQALVELAPHDASRIETTAARLFDEAARDSGAFYKRSAGSMQRVGRALMTWNQDGQRKQNLQRLKARLVPVCNRIEPAEGRRETCRTLLDAKA